MKQRIAFLTVFLLMALLSAGLAVESAALKDPKELKPFNYTNGN